jgi:hypothetical protein
VFLIGCSDFLKFFYDTSEKINEVAAAGYILLCLLGIPIFFFYVAVDRVAVAGTLQQLPRCHTTH